MTDLASHIDRKKVLVAPLHWGLGHATRCIPLIRELLSQGAEVSMASDGEALTLLRQEFPALPFFTLPSYNIRYPTGSFMALKMMAQLPGIIKTIHIEHEALEKILDQHPADIVISDNRYGLWTKKAMTVFMTHQIAIKSSAGFRWTEPLLQKNNFKFISRFDECWVPDSAGNENLSGELSHGFSTPFKTTFIGPLSRFQLNDGELEPRAIYDVAVILSGPEPQRSLLEKIMREQLSIAGIKSLLIRGTGIENTDWHLSGNITVVNHLPTVEMQKAITESSMVVCRSGYSGIMDLAVLGKKAILIPTPGQTEQEYLARYFKERGIFYSMRQSDFDLKKALAESAKYSGFSAAPATLLNNVVESLLT